MKKRVLSLLLVVLMVVSLVPISALADKSNTDVAYAVEGGNIYLDKATGTITDCDYRVTEAIIPAEIDGVKVTSIGEWAFRNCTKLTSIEIPNSVTSIGYNAFGGCTSLASINIPNSVTSIGGSAFQGCTSLASIDIPNSVTSIGNYAFDGCTSLTSVTIPNSVTSIGECVFRSCTSLTSATIPNSVTLIGEGAFGGCTSLASVTIPESVTSIGAYAFRSCTSLTSATIPNSVTSIGECVFSGCTSLTSINVEQDNAAYSSEDGVLFDKEKTKLICYPAGSDRTEYCIPDGVKHVVDIAFWGGNYLKSITVPVSVERVCVNTFDGLDNLKKLNYKGTVKQANAIVIYDSTETYITYPISIIPADIHCTDGIIHHYDDATVPPTCTTTGYTHHVCKYCNDSYDDDIKAELGHNFVDGKCKRCGVSESTVTPPHTHDYKAVVTKPTCTQAGYTTYTCSCGDSYKSDYKDALGHDYQNGTCTRCGAKDPSVTPPHTHDYKSVVTKPTCTEQGYTTYTCSICGDSYKGDYKDARGHLFVLGKCLRCGEQDPDSHTHEYTKTVVAPTCTTRGYTEHVCSCGSSYKTDYTAALGHDYKNGLCTRCGAKDPGAHTHDYKATVTKPTCTERGYTTYTCSVCGDSYKGSYVDPLGHNYKNGTCTRCGTKDPNYKPQADFTDVAAGSYCYDAVQWAVANGITNGTDTTHFSPNAGCTRGQVVTFLWRAAGEPTVGGNVGFVDVAPGSYCYEAVKWAVANGITKGTDATHFSPNETCTRGQVVTFMYRAEGEPAVGGNVGFVDVAAGSYCYNAVQWAVANGITKGTDATHFSPNATCTRGQVVTFLYRAQ